jgi:serine/threonine-protein kinase
VPTGLKTLITGDVIGRWVVDHCISPGIPRLYLAYDFDDEDTKALLTTLSLEGTEQLRREASVLRALSHPSVPELIDFGVSNEHGLAWMATKEFDAETLQDRFLAGPIPWKEACSIFHQLARGLRHAHEHSIVHRDISPVKILLDRGNQAQIVGFETAMDESELSQAAEVQLGPLGYLAPEVITKGRRAGPRADLYALGVVLYEALTGRPAFPAALMDGRADPVERMLDWKTRSEPLRPTGDLPDWLKNIVEKATHPDPSERLPDLDAFVGWLDAARGFWEPKPPPEQAADATPPPLLMAKPSLGEPAPVLSDPETVGRVMPLAYFTAAALGVAVGVVFSVLVILVVELPAMG